MRRGASLLALLALLVVAAAAGVGGDVVVAPPAKGSKPAQQQAKPQASKAPATPAGKPAPSPAAAAPPTASKPSAAPADKPSAAPAKAAGGTSAAAAQPLVGDAKTGSRPRTPPVCPDQCISCQRVRGGTSKYQAPGGWAKSAPDGAGPAELGGKDGGVLDNEDELDGYGAGEPVGVDADGGILIKTAPMRVVW